MHFIYKCGKKKTSAIQRAIDLQEKAANSDNEQDALAFYIEAYKTYTTISQKFWLKDEIKGQAVYSMYLLVKEGKVKLSPIITNDITYQTPQDRLEKLLIDAVDLGYDKAITELTTIYQEPSILSSFESSNLTTPTSSSFKKPCG